ncbi:MAG: FAD-dependent oxidoreductase [Henriciella sp.]
MLEGRDRIGGRTFTNSSIGAPLDMGASWIHGISGNSMYQFAQSVGTPTIPWDYDNDQTFDLSGGASPISDAQLAAATNAIETEIERLSVQNADAPVQQAIDNAIASGSLSGLTQTQIDYLVNADIELSFATSVERLSVQALLEGEEVVGGDVILRNGYITLVDELASGLDIRLNQKVTGVDYTNPMVRVQTESGSFEADYVIVTVPLGVLKQGGIQFQPALPMNKQTAIDAMGMGTLNKVYLRFPNRFWASGVTNFNRIAAPKGAWPFWLDMEAATGVPILGALVGGDFAVNIEQSSDAAIVSEAMTAIRSMFGASVPDPTDFLITRWTQDEFAFGSYSELFVGARPSMRTDLARSIEDRVFFAGEATSSDFPSTTHGAYMSGEQAASRVAQLAT